VPRPRFSPTREQRNLVKSLAAYGASQDSIAALVGLRSPKTLRRHFRGELDRGAVEANSQVAQSLFKMATSGNSPAAAMFWLKCRAGWREQSLETSAQAAPPFIVTGEKEIPQ
jgi:hypothetical protein